MARAKRQYAQTWRRTAKYFGAKGQPAPNVVYLKHRADRPNPAFVGSNEEGRATVYLQPKTARRLGRPAANRKARRATKKLLLHEFAHIYQAPYEAIAPEHTEGAAERFANRTFKREFGGRGGPAFYRAERRAYRGAYGKRHWRKRQFGDNYGADPTQLWASYPGVYK